MQFENDGILLWYGTSDAPAPNGTVIEGSEIPITIGVQPPDASNVVEISYCINEGSTETIVAKFLRNEPFERIQYFRAYLSSLKAGDHLEYNVICQCAGRQVPARTDEEQLPNSFQVVAATREEISTPTPEFVNTQQFQGGDRSQSEKVLTNTNTDIQDTPVFSTISEPVSNGLVAERIESTISEPVSKGLAVEQIESTKILPIKISDDRLDSFYSQNPEFDILQFNLLDGQTNNLNWENVERETTLNLLKKYQRLLRINPNPEIAKKLLNGTSQAESPIQSDSPTTSSAQQPEQPQASSFPHPAIDSAQAIASMTEEQFVKMLPGDEATARQMHKKAIDIKAKTQILWANMKDAIASPHFRSMRVSTTDESDCAALARDLPNYQEMFGDLDYIDCEHCGSIFSPAAYVVDLMRIVDQYITEPNEESIHQAEGLTLNERRPDLAKIPLTCEKTNTVVPSLQIINHILEEQVNAALGSSDALKSLAIEKYPFNLPFNFPLEQIRSYLGHLKTDLATIYETFGVNELAIAREYIGLSLEEYNLITTSQTTPEILSQLYGVDNISSEDLGGLTNVETFLKQTGLSRTELPELFEQNLHQDELNAGLAHNFYINQVLEGDRAVQIQTDETNSDETPTIKNLTPKTLDRINRFIRLTKKLNWSFVDLDWVLASIEASEIDEEAIKKIAKIKQLQAKYKLPLDVLCSFWHEMKTIGIGSNPEKPQDLFDRVFNNPLILEILDDKKFYRPQDLEADIQQINLNNLDREAETNPIVGRILAALRLNVNQLIDIVRVIWGQEGTISLTVENLSQLFRTSQILKLLGLNVEEYQGLLSFLSLDIQEITSLSIEPFIQITELAEWVKESQIKIDELDYIITSNLSSNLDIGYSETDIREGMKSLWQLAANSSDQASDLISEGLASFLGIETDLADSLLYYAHVAFPNTDYVELFLTPLQEEQEEWSEIANFFQFLSRIFLLTKKLELTTAELKCVADNKIAFGINELFQLSISNIQTIDRFKKLIKAFNDDKDKLVEYIAGEDKDIEELGRLTGWKSEQISLLGSSAENQENNWLNLGSDLHKTVEGIAKLKPCFNLSRHLGVNVSWFTKLLKLENLPVVGESVIDGNAIANWELYQDATRAVREVAKAKYDDEEWVKVSEKLEGELSERKRDVLTTWILWKNKYENLHHLSQDLLIDVETSSYVSISIIKEATLAIQTYLHRCRMGLESGVNKLDEIPEIWWQWMMNYRVWEANRKVFLYPENYLDPSLRQIKSPIYKELEEELLQSEITQESVEKAYQNYFEKFAEIAQLKPAGGYRCTVENNSGAQDTLYLFGRTATEPYTYYYRECINPEAKNPTWKAWQKIDLVINSEYINATYAFNKLFIFWVEIVTIERKENPDTKAKKETKATIKYSFQKFGKQWIQPQTLAKDIVIEDYDSNPDRNLWRKVTALPIPGNDSEPEKILTLFGNLEKDALGFNNLPTKKTNELTKTATTLTIDLLQENRDVSLQNRPSNAVRSVISNSKLMAISTDNVLYDNYADFSTDPNSRSGLVGYWPMNEGSGTVIRDLAGNNNGKKGDIYPQWTTVTDFRGEGSRKVLEFKGSTGVDLGNPPYLRFDGFQNYTIAAWINRGSDGGGTLISKCNYGVTAGGYTFGVSFNGHIFVSFGDERLAGEQSWSLNSTKIVPSDEWSHVATTYNGDALKIYINGNQVGSKKFIKTNVNNTDHVLVGEDKSFGIRGQEFWGKIAEVRIWDVALSAKPIRLASTPFIPLITNNISKPHVSVTTVKNQPGWFTFDAGDEAFLAIPQKKTDNGLESVPFKQIDNSLEALGPQDSQITLSYNVADGPSDISSLSEIKFAFTRLTTSTIRQLSQKMFIGGLDNLLTLDSQLTPELNFNRFDPSEFVIAPNSRQLDFDGPSGIYFWEIFFHIPFLVANTLNANQRFEEAQKWYHYIFNPTVQPSKGPVGYWPMNEGSGDEIRDRTGNHNGALQGNSQWKIVTDFPGTDSKHVLEFDGESDYISFTSSNAPVDNQSYTITAWIKPQKMGALGIVGWGNYNTPDSKNQVNALRLMDNGIHHYWWANDVSASVGDLTDGWHHVAATFDGTTRKIFLDGQEVASDKPSGHNVTRNDNLTIGRTLEHEPFEGQIAEVGIWDVALSSEQILLSYSVYIVGEHPSDRFWRYLPFRGNNLKQLQAILKDDQAIKVYNDNPFAPHAIARLRIGAYEKVIVMKYIDNLLDWGDQLFAQDNRESINQATLLYFLAYDLLGEEPENLGKRRSPSPKTFQDIKEQYQSAEKIPQFLIDLEHRVNDTTPTAIASAPFNDLNTYFCAPENEQFIAYWERVEDRLYKIRHSLSIEGIRRQLALFQPAIEPAQLVRAVAGGQMPLSVVSQLTPAVPHYRFDYMLDRAKNITSTLIQLGSSLLSALEKKDAEELALLRSSHELSILNLITTTKEKQIEEAKETLVSLEESKKSAEKRNDYYSQLIKDGLSTWENQHLDYMVAAQIFTDVAIASRTVATIAYAIPQVGSPFAMTYGGSELGDVATAISGVAEIGSSTSTVLAQLSQTMGDYHRREQEWELQRDVSEIDIEQIQKQIEAQQIRKEIAEHELKTHEKSIEQAKEIEDFLKGKFTNKELYQWMIGRLSILYFQTYKVALDMAMATQSAYQYELNKDDTYINFDYWDSLKKGLLAGESLMLGLNQLEKAYIEGNVRRLEIEKTISLLQLNPQAFLDLKNNGKCTFELSEKLFDFDFPGHYCRQIKTIAISIPAVVGPYQNIKATLTQTKNETLLKADSEAVRYLLLRDEKHPVDPPVITPENSVLRVNWRRNQKIALSRGAMDNGLFELNFRDERYLPFEGTGAVSTWELSLPKAANRINFDTISDVIITLSYTALDGGDTFRQKVTSLDSLKHYSETYYFNLKQAFPGEWHTFIDSNTDASSQKLNFQISEEIIPPHVEDVKLTQIFFKLDASDASSTPSFITLEIANGQPIEINLQENNIASLDVNSSNEEFPGNWVINFDLTKVPDSLKKDGFLNAEIVNNIELILIYEGEINWGN